MNEYNSNGNWEAHEEFEVPYIDEPGYVFNTYVDRVVCTETHEKFIRIEQDNVDDDSAPDVVILRYCDVLRLAASIASEAH